MQVFRHNFPSDQQGLPHDAWLDERIQSALYSGSTPSALQRTRARANLLRLARTQTQLSVAEDAGAATFNLPHFLTTVVRFAQRQSLSLLRSCFVNDAPYNRANDTSTWVRRRTASELVYLEFAPMAY
ncbi:MAG: hypothetical protein UZ15_CFX003003111 [Chloroflexi bacterium OLB15]|nr:MAG: hypothetical protein UZ15_CFX003003111 [Chloroflexi bacterium OLB15]